MANRRHHDRALLSFWATKDTKEKLQALALTLDYADTSDLLRDLIHPAINGERLPLANILKITVDQPIPVL